MDRLIWHLDSSNLVLLGLCLRIGAQEAANTVDEFVTEYQRARHFIGICAEERTFQLTNDAWV